MELAEARVGGADNDADLQASALLAVRGLTIRFGGVTALDNVSFEVAPRRDLRPDRPERRRQDDALQLHLASL